MESVQLSQFLRAVNNWPKTKADLSAVAERIIKLLDGSGATAPSPTTANASPNANEIKFAAIFCADEGGRMGFRLAGPLSSADPSVEATFEEFLRKQVRHAIEQGGAAWNGNLLRHIQVARESVPWTQLATTQHLTFVQITADIRSGTGTAGSLGSQGAPQVTRNEAGWVAVGTSKALSAKDEILLIAIVGRLTELYKVAQYEAALQLRNQFLSIASHELKTPLTSIYGILQLQERMERMERMKGEAPSSPSEERKANFLKIVIRQVERLNELIDGLLDVSRIQNGRFMVEPSEVDVATLLRDTVGARLTMIAQENGVGLQIDAPEHLTSWVDPVRTEEVITNLVMNGIRFSPEGGTVSIRLRQDDGSFRLSVRDQGPSVPIEDRERIFQPFERAQRTARLGGLGLGLFISRQIAQLHGGTVSLAESVQGKGNVFEASFPVRTGNGSGLGRSPGDLNVASA